MYKNKCQWESPCKWVKVPGTEAQHVPRLFWLDR